MNFIYDTSTPYIEYNTTEEYRAYIRTICKMDCESKRKEIYNIYGDLDKESIEELLYDEKQMIIVMDQI